MQSFPLEDYSGVIECATGLALRRAGIYSRTSRGGFVNELNNQFSTTADFQTVRPRVDILFFYTGGRGRFFVQPGLKPSAGTAPECAHQGTLSVTLITEADFVKHSIYIGAIRRQFNTIVPVINAILGGKYVVQNIIAEATDPRIAVDKNQCISTLSFKYEFGINYLYDWQPTLAQIRATMPCDSAGGGGVCPCTDPAAVSAILQGRPGSLEQIQLLISGWYEAKGYTGGDNNGAYFQTGGDPDPQSTYNIAKLTVSSNPVPYYLNRFYANAAPYLSYAVTIPANVGDTIKLELISVDAHENTNNGGVEVPGIPGILPNLGQWIQIDQVPQGVSGFVDQTVEINDET